METTSFIFENHSIIIGSIIFTFLLLGFISVFLKIRRAKLVKKVTSLKRGTKSERDLILKLLKHRIPAQTIFHDLFIEKNNGEFSQVDLVVATKEGIIVIEVKDYSGWIYGNGYYNQWTQVLAYGKKKYRFYNPIMQNRKHIESLKKTSRQFKNIPFYSIIIFYGDCVLKEINYVPKDTYLVKSSRIFEVLKLIRENNEPAPYTNKKEIVEIFKQAVRNGDNIKNHKKHVENIKDLLGKERIFN